ncbi:hypothetical protein GY45DRAFT_719670 [Cubamyces sp. BRFM 1775]|nr:hypothetical protein GY45DRAFT_719670 [Cubamyces sp. BRFM 1775]
MTQTLIPLLKEDPHPPCRQLVQRLGSVLPTCPRLGILTCASLRHKQHEISMDVHAASRRQWEKIERGKHVRWPLDGVNFQDPQASTSSRKICGGSESLT